MLFQVTREMRRIFDFRSEKWRFVNLKKFRTGLSVRYGFNDQRYRTKIREKLKKLSELEQAGLL